MPLWKNLEVKGDLDNFGEDFKPDAKLVADRDFHLVAAKVRGVAHKHEGLNCDDHYEFRDTGTWTLVAVADGAGSAKLSRVGSRAACQGAIGSLERDLKGHQPATRDAWTNDSFQRDGDSQTLEYSEPDLEHMQLAIHRAFISAVDAIDEAVLKRQDDPRFVELLGRPPQVSDFKTTLLLVVHARIVYKDRDYSLAMACQVGDGLIAATTSDWKVSILSQADHGEFGSETKFLSRTEVEPAKLARRTIHLFAPIRALFVMTDGVADIYFPPETQVLRLHGDLVANRVLVDESYWDDKGERAVGEALQSIGAPMPGDLGKLLGSEAAFLMKYVNRDGVQEEHRLPLIGPFAARLGMEVRQVLATPALTRAAVTLLPCENIADNPESRLLTFLDLLEVRSQRDDRTLVVLYPIAPAPVVGGAS